MMLPANSYNPSIVRFHGKTLLSCRAHDRKDWRTNLYLSELGQDYRPINCVPITVPSTLTDHSHEDARLFNYKGELWASWTVGKPYVKFHRCAVAFGRISLDAKECKIVSAIFPKWGNNDFGGMEKNWLPLEIGNQLWCYYGNTEKDQTFIRLDGERVVESVKTPALPWNFGPIHGGAITLRGNGNLLFFFNSRTRHGSSRQSERYHIGCAELRGCPPFEVLRISQKPILYGQEGYCLDGHKWFKPNVVFACGAVDADDRIILAHGWNDSQCRIAKVKHSELNFDLIHEASISNNLTP